MNSTRLAPAICAIVFCATLTVNSYAAERTIHTFQAKPGATPYGSLVSDANGNLYGVTASGGDGCRSGGNGCGTIYELSPTSGGGWNVTTLYIFKGGTDGFGPSSALIFDANGNLYGTTTSGGVNGAGTAFELSPIPEGGWTESVIYSFGASSVDGNTPFASVTFDHSGNLYGTTVYGGSDNFGTVFELSPSSGGWIESVLYSFEGDRAFPEDGAYPYCSLIFDSLGNLYGTTFKGGVYSGGEVFELMPSVSGWQEQVLYSFRVSTLDGTGPQAGVIFDPAGNLYGTTYSGGGPEQGGTVFELSPINGGEWQESIIHTFLPSKNDGGQPVAAPIMDASGNLYGTTGGGGSPIGDGTVYSLTSQSNGRWAEARYNFKGEPGGQYPLGGLIFYANGVVGTTAYGGTGPGDGYGLAFEILP
jgi:uncharacterized repeat protein (TIGR03803 family)